MRATIDAAGRLVIPKPLRDQVGLTAGAVEITAIGAALRLEALSGERVEEEDGRLVIPASGVEIGDRLVQALRQADQR